MRTMLVMAVALVGCGGEPGLAGGWEALTDPLTEEMDLNAGGAYHRYLIPTVGTEDGRWEASGEMLTLLPDGAPPYNPARWELAGDLLRLWRPDGLVVFRRFK